MMKKPKNNLELNINKVNQQSTLLYSINSIYSHNPSSTKSKKSKIDYDSLLAASKKTTSNNNKVSLHKISKFSNQVSTPQSISSYNTTNKSNRNKNQTKTSNLIITKALSHSQFKLNLPSSNQRKSVLTSYLIIANDQQQEKSNQKEKEEVKEKEKDKIKSLRKLVLSNQKQISLTEKQLKISNNEIGNDNFQFERNIDDTKQDELYNNLNNKKKNNKVKTNGDVNFIVKQDLTHKKQAKSDYLSSQIRLSINNYLKSKQTTPKNMTKYSSSSKEIESLIDISNRKLKACSRLNNCIVNSSKEKKDNKEKIIKERIKTNKQIKEIFRKTNQINSKNKIKIDSKLKSPDVISTIKSMKSLNLINNIVDDNDKDIIIKEIQDINVTYSSKVSILNILEDKKEDNSSKSNSSSCLLDKYNNLKRETFVGNIKNKKKNMKNKRNLIQNKEIIYDYIGEEVNENENFSVSDLFIKEKANNNESSNILFPYSTFFKYISNSFKEISLLVNSQDEKENSKSILNNHSHSHKDSQNNDNNAYLCRNLKYITDPEYDLLLFYKSSEKRLLSLESDYYQKSFLSKEILRDKEKSFMMSSINEEIKNILNYQSSQSNSLSIERRLSKSATVTSFRSYNNKLDDTQNQYEEYVYEYEKHIESKEIKNLKYKSSQDIGLLHNKNKNILVTQRIFTEVEDRKEENNDIQRKNNCNIY